MQTYKKRRYPKREKSDPKTDPNHPNLGIYWRGKVHDRVEEGFIEWETC